MSGVSDLTTLLATMEPVLSDGEMVFCTAPDSSLEDVVSLLPVGVFREREGLSFIIAKTTAEIRGIPSIPSCNPSL